MKLKLNENELSLTDISAYGRKCKTPAQMVAAMEDLLDGKFPYFSAVKKNDRYKLIYASTPLKPDFMVAFDHIDALRDYLSGRLQISKCSLSSEQVYNLIHYGEGTSFILDLDDEMIYGYRLSRDDIPCEYIAKLFQWCVPFGRV